ncbi:hypothetical protein MBOT_02770 [Mycobacterium botniense]|uniref:PE cleavage protein A C-terminal domain-containing protein n=2 Tax=Mycobacterium botniense TaxID=84962 RepID=A0A7I9XSE2_9MYCO|nr:hypothetical protein MBOT_02770 [Mycobacterium botniense]
MADRSSYTDLPRLSRNARARWRRVVAGATVGAFLAVTTAWSWVAAPSAKADLLDVILDPIVQPIVSAMTDMVGAADPSAATDLTTFFDAAGSSAGGLSLNSLDPAAALTPAADPAAASSPADASTAADVAIPLTVYEGTEPAVDVSVNGGSEIPVLVDTGSSGLVVPWQDLGLKGLLDLGFPTGIGLSGYSGGVDYLYLTYDTTVDYGGVVSSSNTPVDVEIFSWPTSPDSPPSFQAFLADDDVRGIMGIGDNDAGPGISPLKAAGYEGVLVDVPQDQLILGPNPYTTDDITLSGAPITNLEVSIDGGSPVAVTGDVDSGGVYGTMPESVTDNLPAGTTITVYDGSGQELYSYTTTATNDPTLVSSSSDMDTGYEPFLQYPIYINYTDDTMVFVERW